MLQVIWALIIFTVIAVFFLIVFRYLDVKTQQEYQSLYEHEYYQKASGDCPAGCLNGVCQSDVCFQHQPPYPKCCAFDFQCKYCTTQSGDSFAQVYEDIKRKYKQNQNRQEVKRLNDRIFTENVYIAKLNKYIEANRI